MRTTTTNLILGLALTLAFAAGFAYDRWLHRPITVDGMTIKFVDNSAPRTPPSKIIPPCIANCEPTDPTGDESTEIGPDDATQASCYGDGSIPCPGARRPRAYGDCKRTDVICSPQELECWWAPGGENNCQKET